MQSYVATAHDVTTLAQRHQLNDQLLGALDASRDAIVIYDAQSQPVFVNRGAAQLLGISSTASAEAAATFFDAVRNQVPREVLTDMTRSTWTGELGHRSPDGIMLTLSVTLHVVRDHTGATVHYSVLARDETEAKQMHNELQRQATHDELTGLPNRRRFLAELREAFAEAESRKERLAIGLVDLDGFKNKFHQSPLAALQDLGVDLDTFTQDRKSTRLNSSHRT